MKIQTIDQIQVVADNLYKRAEKLRDIVMNESETIERRKKASDLFFINFSNCIKLSSLYSHFKAIMFSDTIKEYQAQKENKPTECVIPQEPRVVGTKTKEEHNKFIEQLRQISIDIKKRFEDETAIQHSSSDNTI